MPEHKGGSFDFLPSAAPFAKQGRVGVSKQEETEVPEEQFSRLLGLTGSGLPLPWGPA